MRNTTIPAETEGKMNRREFLIVFGYGCAGELVLSNTGFAQSKSPSSRLEEYCFQISPAKSIGMRQVDTTPERFLRENPNVEAAINGIYFGQENKLEGIAYLADGHHFAAEKPEHIRGYFTVDRKGNKIQVSESLAGNIDNYWLVIGTHPLLVTNGEVHSQANEERYKGVAYRSAIGTKNSNVCFAVSTDQILMNEWARRLKDAGYKGTINLDGGPISQMVVRDKERILVKGGGNQNTRLVIFSYNH